MGLGPEALLCMGQCSKHWSSPARARTGSLESLVHSNASSPEAAAEWPEVKRDDLWQSEKGRRREGLSLQHADGALCGASWGRGSREQRGLVASAVGTQASRGFLAPGWPRAIPRDPQACRAPNHLEFKFGRKILLQPWQPLRSCTGISLPYKYLMSIMSNYRADHYRLPCKALKGLVRVVLGCAGVQPAGPDRTAHVEGEDAVAGEAGARRSRVHSHVRVG